MSLLPPPQRNSARPPAPCPVHDVAGCAVCRLLGEGGGGCGGVVGLGDGAYDDDAGGSGGEDVTEVGVVDAADGEPGTVGPPRGDVLEEGYAGGGAAGFGGGGPHRAGAEVVDSWFGGRGVGLGGGVCAAADEGTVAD